MCVRLSTGRRRSLDDGHGDVRSRLIDFGVLAMGIYLQKCRHDEIVFLQIEIKKFLEECMVLLKIVFFFLSSQLLRSPQYYYYSISIH